MTAASGRKRRALRGAKTRFRQKLLDANRIVARLSGRHTYAQIIAPNGRVLAAAATSEKPLRESLGGKCSNVAAATGVGEALAKKAAGMDFGGRLAFDRGGRKYHGRIRALAEALRAGGLKF